MVGNEVRFGNKKIADWVGIPFAFKDLNSPVFLERLTFPP
jgi:hypothetical protein